MDLASSKVTVRLAKGREEKIDPSDVRGGRKAGKSVGERDGRDHNNLFL